MRKRYDPEKSEEPFFDPPHMFDRDSMRSLYADQFARFVDLKVHGHRSEVAFRMSFPRYARSDDQFAARQRLEVLETSQWYFDAYNERLAEVQKDVLWNEKKALNRLLRLVEDPDCASATKARAIRELNIMRGIVFVDEFNNTRAGSSLADFYKTEGKRPGMPGNPHKLPDDIAQPEERPEQHPPAEALPKVPESVPVPHASLIGDALQPVQPKPVVQARPDFGGLRAVKG